MKSGTFPFPSSDSWMQNIPKQLLDDLAVKTVTRPSSATLPFDSSSTRTCELHLRGCPP